MNLSPAAAPLSAARPPARPLAALSQRVVPALLWLTVFSGGFVMFEPSPYEASFLLLALFVALAPPRLPALLLLPLLLLGIMNVGGLVAAVGVMDKAGARDVLTYVAISFYLALTTILFAAIVAQQPEARLITIRRASIAAAFVVSCAGIAGYFDLASLGDVFTKYGRAQGTFKDPNVYGPFLILPLLFLVQDMLRGEARRPLLGMALVLLITAGLFLSFSRAAWANFIFCGLLMTYLMYLTAPDRRRRARIISMSVLGGLGLALVIAGLLAVPKVREVFLVRAELVQNYDGGSHGRFATQLKSLPKLLENPAGLGPYQYSRLYDKDPHNVYLQGFAVYGWFGGISYLLFVLLTLGVGLVSAFRRVPWQNAHIVVIATFTGLALEGAVVDTDHWRHFYLLAGLVWGLSAAGLAVRQSSARAPTPASEGSGGRLKRDVRQV